MASIGWIRRLRRVRGFGAVINTSLVIADFFGWRSLLIGGVLWLANTVLAVLDQVSFSMATTLSLVTLAALVTLRAELARYGRIVKIRKGAVDVPVTITQLDTYQRRGLQLRTWTRKTSYSCSTVQTSLCLLGTIARLLSFVSELTVFRIFPARKSGLMTMTDCTMRQARPPMRFELIAGTTSMSRSPWMPGNPARAGSYLRRGKSRAPPPSNYLRRCSIWMQS